MNENSLKENNKVNLIGKFVSYSEPKEIDNGRLLQVIEVRIENHSTIGPKGSYVDIPVRFDVDCGSIDSSIAVNSVVQIEGRSFIDSNKELCIIGEKINYI